MWVIDPTCAMLPPWKGGRELCAIDEVCFHIHKTTLSMQRGIESPRVEVGRQGQMSLWMWVSA